MSKLTTPFWNDETTLNAHRGESFIGIAHSDKVGESPFEDIWLDDHLGDPKLVRQFGEDEALRAEMPLRLFKTACLTPAWQRAHALWSENKGEYYRLRNIADKTAEGATPSGSQNADLADRFYLALLEAAGLVQA